MISARMLARHCPGACVQIGSRYLETARWGPSPTEAATLVLLHEGLGCVALWRDVPERLAEATGCGVCAYSRFGYGRSDPQPLPWKLTYMQDEARDILPQVLDEACIRDAVLVGHSDGGSIAAVYVRCANGWRAITAIRTSHSTAGAIPGWTGFRHFDITGCIPQIDVPILGLQGAEDPYGSDEQLLTLQRLALSPCEIAFINGARHSPQLEARDDTIGRIAQFVQHLPFRGRRFASS